MTINILTLFPGMFSGFLTESLTARAIERGIVSVNAVDIRDYSADKHRRADDYPFGGGAGMVMTCQPVFDCFAAVSEGLRGLSAINVYMSPAGQPLNTALARHLAGFGAINILCGHYEGVDERIIESLIDMEISIGDYVLTGGELPAMVLCDCVMRFVPGFLGNGESACEESFADGLLEYPQYTRPAVYNGMAVPEVLLSGHHKNIESWRRERALERTQKRRPDLIKAK